MNLREEELHRINPEFRPILAMMFDDELTRKAFGVNSFEEWYFTLNDLQREEFVATTNGGDPSVVVRHFERYIKGQVQRRTEQSDMLGVIKRAIKAGVSGTCTEEEKQRAIAKTKMTIGEVVTVKDKALAVVEYVNATGVRHIPDICRDLDLKDSTVRRWEAKSSKLKDALESWGGGDS